MRDSLSILDQCSGTGEKLTVESVLSSVGGAGKEHTSSLALSVSKNNGGGCLETINTLYSASKDMQRLCDKMISLFRDILIIKTVENTGKGFINCSFVKRYIFRYFHNITPACRFCRNYCIFRKSSIQIYSKGSIICAKMSVAANTGITGSAAQIRSYGDTHPFFISLYFASYGADHAAKLVAKDPGCFGTYTYIAVIDHPHIGAADSGTFDF
jgi:hypothetical protein